MRKMSRALAATAALPLILWACGFDESLREYLHMHFWLPFAKKPEDSAKRGVKRVSAPFAGMQDSVGSGPLAKLRAEYHKTGAPTWAPPQRDASRQRVASLVGQARADTQLSAAEREETELIAAKIEMRASEDDDDEGLRRARGMFEAFLRTAKTPHYLSEARGWLGRVHYLLGNQTAAGKIYLDELNRPGSNLSQETLIDSLQMTYGYDGGQELLKHLEEYFDTPEHAVFAVQLATNPRERRGIPDDSPGELPRPRPPYGRVKQLVEKHRDLLRRGAGADVLALLGMRAALRDADPPATVRIAAGVPAASDLRNHPDFQWTLAGAHFLSRNFAAAEEPLRKLFASRRASQPQRAAAAYGLCGVYQKLGNRVEQLHFALWLKHEVGEDVYSEPARVQDMSVYWAPSGWDFAFLLEAEATISEIQAFLEKYPSAPGIRLVRYGLAVRLAREDRYEEAAAAYELAGAKTRAQRMRRMAELHRASHREGASPEELLLARYREAEFLGSHSERVYFNDLLWNGFQRYALFAEKDTRLTLPERRSLIALERKLKDDQEELWRAHAILRGIVREAGPSDVGRRAAQLAIRCVRLINTERFGREQEVRAADIELSVWLRRSLPGRRAG